LKLTYDNNGGAFTVEQNRRRYILLFVSYITSAIMLFMGVRHFLTDDTGLQFILFGCSAAFVANVLWFHRTNQLELACLIEASLVAVFVLGLVYHGGFEQTSLYWVFPFPPIIFGLLGARRGIAINLLLVAGLMLILYGPDFGQSVYRDAETTRFIASMLTLIITCLINEHFRERSHHSMDMLQRTKTREANTDVLTQLANRRFVDQELPQYLSDQPELFFPMTLVLADLDHFKHINDSFGHPEGDNVLREVAALFRRKLRSPDIACRIGGEEFLLILPKTSLADALKVAEKIRATIAQQRFISAHPDLVITCSFGVAEISSHRDFAIGLQQADSLLYQAKAEGRNLVKS
jgi:diguanylate cyclase (GGDEF)-like protein